MTRIAYDATLKRPGCVLIAAALGGDPAVAKQFPSEVWLTDLTPDMQVYEVTKEQVEFLLKIAEKGKTHV